MGNQLFDQFGEHQKGQRKVEGESSELKDMISPTKRSNFLSLLWINSWKYTSLKSMGLALSPGLTVTVALMDKEISILKLILYRAISVRTDLTQDAIRLRLCCHKNMAAEPQEILRNLFYCAF